MSRAPITIIVSYVPLNKKERLAVLAWAEGSRDQNAFVDDPLAAIYFAGCDAIGGREDGSRRFTPDERAQLHDLAFALRDVVGRVILRREKLL